MPVDPRSFWQTNMADTCSVWNVLSSSCLYQGAVSAGCTFSCTEFVLYECLQKPRQLVHEHDVELQRRLREEQKKGRFQTFHLEIEDLQELDILERRKKLGKGELSSIAFAKRTSQAFLTDDRGAFRLAREIMVSGHVQSTPHLFSWMIYERILLDSDKQTIIKEHESMQGQLTQQFEESYAVALQYRLSLRRID
jgi:predicted nucleic acid-binding protein